MDFKLKRKISDLRLGTKRSSMKQNQLLSKYKIGTSLNLCYDLPKNKSFIYGKPNRKLDGGVAECFSAPPICSTSHKYKVKRERDFMQLNKGANICGFINAKEHAYYRAAITYKPRIVNKPLMKLKSNLHLPSDMTFGKKSLPSEPINDIIEHKYQDIWISEHLKTEKQVKDKKLLKKTVKPYWTKSVQMRVHQPPVEGVPLWKMPKFNKINGHLSTFRSDWLKKEAFEYHQADATGRCGIYGHGVIEAAKSY